MVADAWRTPTIGPKTMAGVNSFSQLSKSVSSGCLAGLRPAPKVAKTQPALQVRLPKRANGSAGHKFNLMALRTGLG